jgi:hypothetical protein
MNALSGGDIDIDDVSHYLAPKFVHTFTSLLNVMEAQETELRNKQAEQASRLNSQLNRASSSITSPRFIVDSMSTASATFSLSEPRTPDQPIHPSDPKWNGSSTASKDEEATKKLLSNLLSDTMLILESDFRRIQWQQSGLKVELVPTCFLHYTLTDY